MKGYSHAVIGCATSIVVSNILGIEYNITSLGIATIAGLLPDIDMEHSTINSKLPFHHGKFIYMIASLVLFYSAYKTSNILLLGPAALLLFVNVSSHRGFTHSILACCGFSIYLFPNITNIVHFSISYMTHIVCDMINTKGVQLLYPLKKRFKFPVNFTMNSVMGKTIELLAVLISSAVIIKRYIR